MQILDKPERLGMNKPFSFFVESILDEEIKFFNIETWSNGKL